MGDFVVWRRDDLPAYQLVSVIEDRDAAVTHIVRGRDLLPSTAAQLFLAPYLRADALLEADIRHHELVKATSGEKLSKSQGGDVARLPRTDEARAVVHRTAEMLGAPLGITPPR